MENKYCQSCGMSLQKQEEYITLTKDTIDIAHICCGFADKKCKESYELKKAWLRNEFNNGYVLDGWMNELKFLLNMFLLKKPGFRLMHRVI